MSEANDMKTCACGHAWSLHSDLNHLGCCWATVVGAERVDCNCDKFTPAPTGSVAITHPTADDVDLERLERDLDHAAEVVAKLRKARKIDPAAWNEPYGTVRTHDAPDTERRIREARAEAYVDAADLLNGWANNPDPEVPPVEDVVDELRARAEAAKEST